MYKGYNLRLENMPKSLLECKSEGETSYNKINSHIKEHIDSVASDDKIIDGSKLQANWFPQMNADVFISHSSLNLENAKMLAGWLKKQFNLDSFIDSCIWGNAYKLLKLIDNTYCYNKDHKTYDYDKRNRSTCHVYMMLTNALSNMIDNTECVIFLNTPQSIVLDEDKITDTYSPWIYTEIAMTNLVEKKKKRKTVCQKLLERLEIIEKTASWNMTHPIDLRKYTTLTPNMLSSWSQCGMEGDEALDYLYEKITGFKG